MNNTNRYNKMTSATLGRLVKRKVKEIAKLEVSIYTEDKMRAWDMKEQVILMRAVLRSREDQMTLGI